MEIKLAPSMLAADFTRLGEQIRECETAGAPWLHIDVMDGIFVPNISFGTVAYEGLRKISNMFFDVHLMITEPERYIDRFIKSGADGVTFHIEATKKPDECIDIIKSAGKKAAAAICPETPVSAIEPYLDRLDMALVMSVHPGYGGQKLIPSCVRKVEDVRRMAVRETARKILIEVDGGVSASNIREIADAGARVFVVGSAFFGQKDRRAAMKGFQEALDA